MGAPTPNIKIAKVVIPHRLPFPALSKKSSRKTFLQDLREWKSMRNRQERGHSVTADLRRCVVGQDSVHSILLPYCNMLQKMSIEGEGAQEGFEITAQTLANKLASAIHLSDHVFCLPDVESTSSQPS